MKRFAVAIINHYENLLKLEIIFASDWQDAIWLHSLSPFNSGTVFLDLAAAQAEAFNLECGLDVVEIL